MKNLIKEAKNILIEKASEDDINKLLDDMRGETGVLKEVEFINKNFGTSHRFRIISNDFDVSGGDPIIYMDKRKSSIQFHSEKIKTIRYGSGGKRVSVEFSK